jgi:hypothetical protein
MDTVVTLSDGSQLRSTTTTWAGAGEPAPGGVKPLPDPEAPPISPVGHVEPLCQGEPGTMCRTMAETAFGELSTEAVIAILVRCGEPPCTDKHGVGDTVVSYADGSTRSSSWEYAGN